MRRFRCPCGEVVGRDAAQFGTHVKCPDCGRYLRVPEHSAGRRVVRDSSQTAPGTGTPSSEGDRAPKSPGPADARDDASPTEESDKQSGPSRRKDWQILLVLCLIGLLLWEVAALWIQNIHWAVAVGMVGWALIVNGMALTIRPLECPRCGASLEHDTVCPDCDFSPVSFCAMFVVLGLTCAVLALVGSFGLWPRLIWGIAAGLMVLVGATAYIDSRKPLNAKAKQRGEESSGPDLESSRQQTEQETSASYAAGPEPDYAAPRRSAGSSGAGRVLIGLGFLALFGVVVRLGFGADDAARIVWWLLAVVPAWVSITFLFDAVLVMELLVIGVAGGFMLLPMLLTQHAWLWVQVIGWALTYLGWLFCTKCLLRTPLILLPIPPFVIFAWQRFTDQELGQFFRRLLALGALLLAALIAKSF